MTDADMTDTMYPAAKPIPEGYHAVTPFVIVKGAARFIDFM